MTETYFPILTCLILLPLLGCAGVFFIKTPVAVRRWALGVSLTEMLMGLFLLQFQLGTAEFQFVESVPWVPTWGLQYFLGVDGISVFMVALTLIMFPFCIICSWTSIINRVREFHICLFVLISALIGVFSALDLVLFYLFWEAILIPTYLLISLWGGPQRDHAALKFILYTLAGSALLLVVVIAFRVEGGSFSIPALMNQSFSVNFQQWTFLIMALAFAVKVPLFPFHTWLPAAYGQAPIAGSIILSAVMAKMGAYGFLRLGLPLAPEAAHFFAPLIIAMSVCSILYGGLLAFAQSNLKKIIAYSSLGHMGFVILGIFLFNINGVQGAVIQMVNHGITTGALFAMVGILYQRSGSHEISGNLGLGKFVPAFMGFWGLFAFAGFAFPGTNNFVGEFLILVGAFERNLWLGAVVVPGALLAAAYMLRPTQKMTWGEPSNATKWRDMSGREWACLLPMAFLVLYLGLAPTLCLKVMNPSLKHLIVAFQSRVSVTLSIDKNLFSPVNNAESLNGKSTGGSQP
jgi:NADH-quinone oxidoreductase subunit M